MVEENEYINQIWEKYDNCQKHSRIKEKYRTQLYKKGKNKLIVKSFFSMLTIIFSTIGVAYAGVAGYNTLIQRFTKTDYNITQDYSQNDDMIYQDGLYYQKIMTFKKYEECSKRWKNLVQMTEEDFTENFVLVIAIESATMQGVSVNEINTEENQMCVVFNKDSTRNYDDNIISVKVNKEQNRENMVFKIGYNSGTYAKLEELPIDYNKEKALADGCVVLENRKMISNSLETWQKFLEQSKNGENSFVRIVYFEGEKCRIKDVEYKDETYYICIDSSRIENGKKSYKIGYYLHESHYKHNDAVLVYIEDEIGNQTHIIAYENQ